MDYLADNTLSPTPFTLGYTVVEKVIGRDIDKPKPILTKEQMAKFDRWAKEDFYKDDPHKDMWDPNWINKKENVHIDQHSNQVGSNSSSNHN
jgi:hypothetical protein